jgi:hypothetical protein
MGVEDAIEIRRPGLGVVAHNMTIACFCSVR